MNLPVYAPHYIATGKPMMEGDVFRCPESNVDYTVTKVVKCDRPWKPRYYDTAFFARVGEHNTAFQFHARAARAEWREVQA